MQEKWLKTGAFKHLKITEAPYKSVIKLVQFMNRDCQAPKLQKNAR